MGFIAFLQTAQMPTSADSRTQLSTLAPPTSGFRRGPRFLLCSAVGLIILITAIRAAVCWRDDSWVEHPSGVIIAMAADLRDGVFYRPLFGPDGYGGTRYFPLYFVLHALLLKLGMPVLPSAYLLSAAAVCLLLLGVFYLLRGLGVATWLAACSSAAVLAASSAQMALTNPHADGLASALNVCGLAVIVRPKVNHRHVLLASLLFTLAWSAKLNMVFGFAAAFVWLLARGSRRAAWELAGETGTGCLLVTGAMIVASQGRVLEVFKACVFGGTNRTLMMLGPLHVWLIASRADRGLLLFFFLALFALVFELWSPAVRILQNLPIVFFITTLAVMAVIFGSPGVVANHLVDLQIASIVLFAAWLANEANARPKQLGIYAFALATLLAAVPLFHKLEVWDRRYQPHRFRRAIALIPDTHKPILAENPILPVLAGQRAYVLDPWMLRMLRERIPNFGEPLLEGLRHQAFGAVVLSFANAQTPRARAWYTWSNFGPGFLSALNQHYRLATVVEDQLIYVPITDSSPEIEAQHEALTGAEQRAHDSAADAPSSKR
jgi:hypothetical protein